MHRQMQASALQYQKSKNVVLKCPVFLFTRNTTRSKMLVNGRSLFLGRIVKRSRTEICHLKLHCNTAVLFVFLQGLRDESEIVVKAGGKFVQFFLGHEAMKHLLL